MTKPENREFVRLKPEEFNDKYNKELLDAVIETSTLFIVEQVIKGRIFYTPFPQLKSIFTVTQQRTSTNKAFDMIAFCKEGKEKRFHNLHTFGAFAKTYFTLRNPQKKSSKVAIIPNLRKFKANRWVLKRPLAKEIRKNGIDQYLDFNVFKKFIY